MARLRVVFINFLLISFCFCEFSDNKDTLINAFVSHLNNFPDQRSVYEEPELLKNKEISNNEFYIELKVKTSDLYNVYAPKYQNCTGIVTDSGDAGITVKDIQCSDFVESWTETLEELVTDATTIDGPVQLENEVQSDNASTSGEQFIAIPRERPAPCIGCSTDVDPNAAGVKELAQLGIKQLDRHEPTLRHSLNNVISVQRQVQVVGGVRYILTIGVDYDNCSTKDAEDCAFQKTCKVAVLEKPWQKLPDGSKFRAILSNNCTEEWLFYDNNNNDVINTDDNSHGTTSIDGTLVTDEIIKAQHTDNVQAQPTQEKTLTDQQVKELEEQIIPNSQFGQATDSSYFVVTESTIDASESVQNAKLTTKNKADDSTDVKSSVVFLSTKVPEQFEEKPTQPSQQNNDINSISPDKKKAIDDLMNFFDFAGYEDKKDTVDEYRIKRDYGSALKFLNLAENYQDMKTKIKNARLVHDLAELMVDHLNKMDMKLKNRVLEDIISAEEEYDNNIHYFYIQAKIAIPCVEVKCSNKNKEIKICNGIIESSEEKPSVLYVMCNIAHKESFGKIKVVPSNDPVLLQLVKEAMKKIDTESEKPFALRIKNILNANTQKVSGTLTKISLELEYTSCSKSVPVFKRQHCTLEEHLGFRVCDIKIIERNWLHERKIDYECTERPIDEMFLSSSNQNYFVGSIQKDDPKVSEIVQEALQYLELKSNRNNKQKLVEIKSVSKQNIVGVLINVVFVVGYTSCTSDFDKDVNTCQLLDNEPLRNCTAEVWERTWLEDGRQVKVICMELPTTALKRQKRSLDKNHFVGGPLEKDVNDPQYKSLADESLLKFLQTSENLQHYQLTQIDKVTVQVVSGQLTKIDFRISPTNCQVDKNGLPTSSNCVVQSDTDTITCNASIWDRPWLKDRNIDIQCDPKVSRNKRNDKTIANEVEQDAKETKYQKLADDCLLDYLESYEINQYYKVSNIGRVSTVNGPENFTKIDFEAVPTDCTLNNGVASSSVCKVQYSQDTLSCHAEVQENPELNSRIINVNCQVDNRKVRRKRGFAGGQTEQDPTDSKYTLLAEESVARYVSSSGTTEEHKVKQIVRVTTQVVAGTLTRIDFKVQAPFGILDCHSEIWEQPWLNKKEINVTCSPTNSRDKRQLPGGQTEQDPTDSKYALLAEESLARYVSSSETTEEHKVKQIVRVTTQVVAGTLTRIDFKVQAPFGILDCHSEIWEQPWLNKKEINVTCSPTNSRDKRQLPGGQTEQDPTDSKYALLAEESLARYVSSSETTEEHKVKQIVRVTTQVVAGTLTRIDFKVQAPFSILDCHSEIWEQAWLNKKEINVTCSPTNSRDKRQLRGRQIEQDPTDSKYTLLAEESLARYVSSSGTTEEHKVKQIVKVTTQVVAGRLTRIDFKVQAPFGILDCHSEIWEQPWLNKKEINVTCSPVQSRTRREISNRLHRKGGPREQDPSKPEYNQLAAEALRKYQRLKKIETSLNVIEVKRVIEQLVSGTIYKIDFVAAPTECASGVSNKKLCVRNEILYCHTEVYHKPWVEIKDINVFCNTNEDEDNSDDEFSLINRRSSRFLLSVKENELDDMNDEQETFPTDVSSMNFSISKSTKGDKQEQDPSKYEYSQLATEALRKYQHMKNSSTPHKLIKVKRVITQVVLGVKYQIDFIAAPTMCTSNGAVCDTVKNQTLHCHTVIWDRPWLRKKYINVSCSAVENQKDKDDKKHDSDLLNSWRSIPPATDYLDPVDDPIENDQNDQEIDYKDYTMLQNEKYNTEEYLSFAEQALRKFENTSNTKNLYRVVRIHYAAEQQDVGLRIELRFTTAPTKCLTSTQHVESTNCEFLEPRNVLSCKAIIRFTMMLDANLVKTIEVQCSDRKQKHDGRKIGNDKRNKRNAPFDDYIEDDLLYYYANLAVAKRNTRTDEGQNLYKLLNIHDVRRSRHMHVPLIRMYVDLVKTYCLVNEPITDLSTCNQIEGLPPLLCLVKIYPSPDDEIVIERTQVICEDEIKFNDIAGFNRNTLRGFSLYVYNRDGPDLNYHVPVGETRIIPTLDLTKPFELLFTISETNCTKHYINSNTFHNRYRPMIKECELNAGNVVKTCKSYVYLTPQSGIVKYINVTCKSEFMMRTKRSIPVALDNPSPENFNVQKYVQEVLDKLEMSSVLKYKQRVVVINSYSTQVTAKKRITVDFDVGYTNCLKFEWVNNITDCDFIEHLPRRHCVGVISERLWVDTGREIEVSCTDDETPLEATMDFENAESAMMLAKVALKQIEYKYPHYYKQDVVRIFSLEKQTVAGEHYRMKLEVGYTQCVALSENQDNCKLDPSIGANKFCRVNVWVRPWTNHPPSYRVTCDYHESTANQLYHDMQAAQLFQHFLTTYKPSYINDHAELQERFKIFRENVNKIHELNVYDMGTARYAVTRFADLSEDEFRRKYLGLNPKLKDENQVPMPQAEIPKVRLPEAFDWREHDAVTEVKNQGGCGSCWAFSVTGNIEGQWKKHSGKLVSLSEQELVDCDKLDNGCNGGLPDNAYRAVEQLGGLETELDYPYDGTDDKCAFNASLSRVQISGAVNISSNETDMAKWLVANGPISIGINANAMQFYVGGVSHPWKMLCNPKNLDHGVLIVGYGTKYYPLFNKKLPYWIVKNSWGKSWGEQGYYRVYRGDGTCGLNQMASSAVI